MFVNPERGRLSKKSEKRPRPREPLSPERIYRAALRLADAEGIGALSMRKVGRALGVEAMSLYNHVANKDALLDGVIDLVMGEVELPEPGAGARDWQAALRARTRSIRAVLTRHSWATPLLDSRRNPGPATLAHHEAVLRTLLEAGFSIAQACHAFSLLDSYTYGFVLQERALPFDSAEGATEVAEEIVGQMAPGEFPSLEQMAAYVMEGGYDPSEEFGYGLDVIMESLERLRTAPAPR